MDVLIMGARSAAAVSESSRGRFSPTNSLDTAEAKEYQIIYRESSGKPKFLFDASDDDAAVRAVLRRLDIGPHRTVEALEKTDVLQIYCVTDKRRIFPALSS